MLQLTYQLFVFSSGNAVTCPDEDNFQVNGEPCSAYGESSDFQGECQDGTCLTLCQLSGLEDCLCEDDRA